MAEAIYPKIDGKNIRKVDSLSFEDGQFIMKFRGEHIFSIDYLGKERARLSVENVRIVMDATEETKKMLEKPTISLREVLD